MPDLRGDQAAGLRRLFGRDSLRVVTFVAGSEGVGRSHIVANLAAVLARQGKSVLVLDENAGQDNVATLLGVTTRHDLADVVEGYARLENAVAHPLDGVKLLSAARLIPRLCPGGRLRADEQARLVDCMDRIGDRLDFVLIDAADAHPQGLSPLSLSAQDAVVTVSATGAAITQAYALIKRAALMQGLRQFRIVINKVAAAAEAETIFTNLARVAGQRHVASLAFAGYVPDDENLRQAARALRPVVSTFPAAASAQALRALAGDMAYWPVPESAPGIGQFVRQLLHLSGLDSTPALYAR